jgi:hypothetical protein
MIQLKFILFLILLTVSSLFFSFKSYQKAQRIKKDYERVVKVSSTLGDKLTYLRGENNQLIAQNSSLALRKNELELLLPELKKQISSLGVKLKHAQQVTTTEFTIETPATVVLRDTLVYDSIPIKTFDYRDGYFSIRGLLDDSLQMLNMSYSDTLVQVVYRGEREKPWLWIFSKRKLMQRVSLQNPNAQIHYTNHIKIQ